MIANNNAQFQNPGSASRGDRMKTRRLGLNSMGTFNTQPTMQATAQPQTTQPIADPMYQQNLQSAQADQVNRQTQINNIFEQQRQQREAEARRIQEQQQAQQQAAAARAARPWWENYFEDVFNQIGGWRF